MPQYPHLEQALKYHFYDDWFSPQRQIVEQAPKSRFVGYHGRGGKVFSIASIAEAC